MSDMYDAEDEGDMDFAQQSEINRELQSRKFRKNWDVCLTHFGGEKYQKLAKEEYMKQLKRMFARLKEYANNFGINDLELVKLFCSIMPSSNGRTSAFGADNHGSNPCGITIQKKYTKKHWDETGN